MDFVEQASKKSEYTLPADLEWIRRLFLNL